MARRTTVDALRLQGVSSLAAEGALVAVAAPAEVRLGFGQIQIAEGEHHGGSVFDLLAVRADETSVRIVIELVESQVDLHLCPC
jgi:hypothetical protein